MLISLFILITIITYYIVRDILHPAFMIIFFWTLGFVSISLIPSFYFPNITTQLIIFIYLFEFVTVSIIVSFLINLKPNTNINYHPNIDRDMLKFLIFIFMIIIIYYIVRYIELILSYDTLREYFFRIRHAAVHTDEPLITTHPLLEQSKTYASILTVILFYEIIRQKVTKLFKYISIIFIILVLISTMMEGTRTNFILLVFSYMIMYISIKGNTVILKSIIIFLVFFFIISMFTRGGGLLDDDLGMALYYFFEHLTMYAFGSIISFESFLQGGIETYSSIMIKIINKLNTLMNIFSLDILFKHPVQQQLPFVAVSDNIDTNVYSFLAVRITYFGFYGAAIVTFIHAVIITVVYKLKNNNINFFLLYIMMAPTTILTLFHEYFYAYSPYFIRLLILIGILYYLKPLSKFYISKVNKNKLENS